MGWRPSSHTKLRFQRVQLEKDLSIDKRREGLLAQLELLDELRLKAAEHVQAYQRESFGVKRRVLERKFHIGDMVLKKIMPAREPHPRGKLRPNWEGPYVISALYPGNAYRLVNAEGKD